MLYNNGWGTFAEVTNSPFLVGDSQYDDVYGIVAGDLDGDNLVDLAAANWTDNLAGIFLNANNGPDANLSFTQADSHSLGQDDPEPESLALADLDHDGHLDIVSANYESETVGVLRNLGGSPWAGFDAVEEYILPYGLIPEYEIAPYFVFTPDLDADGLPEICTTDATNLRVHLTQFVNFTQQAGLDFAAPEHTELGTSGDFVHAAVGDLNADGMVDLAVACKKGSGEVWVLLNLTEPPNSRDYNPPNGTPDECECPEVATVSAVSPPDGAIDARKPHPNMTAL